MKEQEAVIYTVLLIVSTIFAGMLGSPALVFLLYVLFALYSFVSKNDNYIYLLFVLVCLSNGIITRDSYIAGMVGIHQMISLLTFLYIIKNSPNLLFNKSHNKLYKNVIYIYMFLVIFHFYTNIKNYYFGLFDTTIMDVIVPSINQILMFSICLLILNKKLNSISFMRILILCIPLFYSVAVILIYLFPDTCLYTSILDSEEATRLGGFIGNGDANTLSAVLAMFISSLILTKNINRYLSYPIIGLSLIAIGLTGSRTGLGAITCFIIYYIYIQKDILKSIKIIAIASVLFVALYPVFQTNVERFLTIQSEQQYEEGDTSNRMGKWFFYLSYHNSNPKTFLTGGQEEISVTWNDKYKVAHNFYIQIIFNAGVVFLFAFAIMMYNNIKSMVMFQKYGIIIAIQLFLILMFVSDYGALICYAVCQFCLINTKRIESIIKYKYVQL